MRRALFAVLLAALVAAPRLGAEEPPPGAFELLQQVREAYSRLAEYRDEGEIEIHDGDRADPEERIRFRTTVRRGEPLELLLEPSGAPSMRFATLDGRIERTLGAGSTAALLVPALLSLGSAALPDPDAALVEGEERCAESSCWVLAAAAPASRIERRLWIDASTRRVRRVEVEVDSEPPRRIVVEHRILAAPEAQASADETPPAGFAESIEVALTTLTVRVVDRGGGAVEDLGPGDFRLLVGDREVDLEAAEWVDPSAPLDAGERRQLEDAGVEPPPEGQLVVFFVQTSLHGSRVTGQLRMLPHAQRFLDTLGPEDRIAVVSYDRWLELRQDFTRDRELVRNALERALVFGPSTTTRPRGGVSLARTLEAGEARRATSPERGLELTARALIPFEGEKLVVYLGWGLGELTPTGVRMLPEYPNALNALDAAHSSVFVLDVSDSDYHSLEAGLRQVAADTGGTYAKTHLFPGAATERLARAVTGHYLLYFRAPEHEGEAKIRIELRDPGRGEVLAPSLVLR